MSTNQYVAQAYVAGSPEAEVIGQTVASFADNLRAEEIAHLLPKYGFDNIDPEAWYPHQKWFDLLKEIDDNDPESWQTFVAFGRSVVETAIMPPEITSIPDFLNALHAIHHLNLRNIPEDEGYHIEKISDSHYHIYHNTPNPDSVIFGFLWGLAAKFHKENENFNVEIIDNDRPDIARSLFDMRWGESAK